jgi:hypothetical protein
MTGVPQGGYRDLMGLFFMSIGFLIRSYQPTISANLLPSTPLPPIVSRLKFWIIGFLLLILWCIFLPTGMVWRANLQQFLSIPVPAVIGFLLFYDISQYIAKGENIAKKILVISQRPQSLVLRIGMEPRRSPPHSQCRFSLGRLLASLPACGSIRSPALDYFMAALHQEVPHQLQQVAYLADTKL